MVTINKNNCKNLDNGNREAKIWMNFEKFVRKLFFVLLALYCKRYEDS